MLLCYLSMVNYARLQNRIGRVRLALGTQGIPGWPLHYPGQPWEHTRIASIMRDVSLTHTSVFCRACVLYCLWAWQRQVHGACGHLFP